MVLFSFVVPVYNVEDYLESCIESLLDQTIQDYEIILVNDGSTDTSSSICQKYSDQNSNVILVNQENQGLAAARNQGIRSSSGEWIIFVDSDDMIWDIDFLKKLQDLVLDSDVIAYGCKQFMDGTNIVSRIKYNELKTINSLPTLEEKIAHLNTINSLSISAWTHACRKSFLLTHNLFFNESIRVSEDIDWFINVLVHNPSLVGLDGSPYYYRLRKNSLSSNIKSNFWEYRYKAIQYSLNHLKNTPDLSSGLQEEILNYLSYQFFLLLGEINLEKNASNRRKAFTEIESVSFKEIW